MGAYITVGTTLTIAGFTTAKILGQLLNKKTLIFLLIYMIGGIISVGGENAVISSIYMMTLSIMSMYSGMRTNVQKMWDDKDVNDKIDAFADKMVQKNKRLKKENERKEREKSA